MGVKINNIAKVLGTFSGSSTDPLLTSNAITGVVNTATNGLGTLTSGKIWIGSGGNVPVAQTFSGAITVNTSGVTTLGSGIVVNSNVGNSAAIALSKLAALGTSLAAVTDGSGVITTSTTTATQIGYLSTATSDVQTQINGKQATITGAASTVVSSNLSNNIVAVTNGSGKFASSSVTTTALGYIGTLSSDAQAQLNARLSVSLGTPANGDIVYYNGSAWTNLARGTNGQALYSTGTTIQWNTPTINGIPVGGTAGQYLAKNSGTDFDANWYTLTTSLITDISATAAQLNASSTYLTSGGVPTGSDTQVLSISSGALVWANAGSGTVTSVAVSGGTTGFTVSGSPITTSGTITLAGTLVAVNGGTGQSAVTTGDVLYGSATNTWSRLGIGSSGQVLTVSGGVPVWATTSTPTPDQSYSFKTDFEDQQNTSSSGGANGFSIYTSGSSYSSGLTSGDVSNHVYGAVYLNLGSTVGNYNTLGRGGTFATGAGFAANYYSRVAVAVSNGTNRFNARIGLKGGTDLTNTNAIMFRYSDNVNSGKWEAVTRSSSTETATDTGITPDGNYHLFQISINSAGTSVTFYIDGSSVATNTTNIPTAAGLTSLFQIERVLGSATTSAFMSVDWYNEILTRSSAR